MKITSHCFVRIFAACLLSLASSGVQATHSATEPSDGTVRSFRNLDPPRKITPFPFFDAKGRKLTLADFRGKIVLLNLWATWCPPCVREMPALNRLQGKFAKTEFVVLPLSLDRGGITAVWDFYLKYRLDKLDIYSDPDSKAGAAFPVDVLPASFIIGRDGRAIRFLRSFVDWDDPAADAMIRRLISERQSGNNHHAAPVGACRQSETAGTACLDLHYLNNEQGSHRTKE